jgi:hypothetical protein
MEKMLKRLWRKPRRWCRNGRKVPTERLIQAMGLIAHANFKTLIIIWVLHPFKECIREIENWQGA